MDRCVPVMLTLPFAYPLNYLDCKELVKPGDMVEVPLGPRTVIGCVWDNESLVPPDLASADPPVRSEPRLKAVRKHLASAVLPESLRRFIDWVAAYTLSPPGSVLAISLRGWCLCVPRSRMGWVRGEAKATDLGQLSAARARLFAVLTDVPQTASEICQKAKSSPATLRALESAGLAQRAAYLAEGSECATQAVSSNSVLVRSGLSDEQAQFARKMQEIVTRGGFKGHLLEGMTGSGKTELYFEAIAACLAKGQQCLVLLPEIALSTQWIERFTARFGFAPDVWHSNLSVKRRQETWRRVREEKAHVVVGARSALFLPFVCLSAIIVDEEHESAFKQEEGVVYNGRDMAVVRAQLLSIPIFLVSATPSLETLENVACGRYQHFKLGQRHGGACLPQMQLLDLRLYPPKKGQFLSAELNKAIHETLERQEQAMLFLNRRGYAPLTLCQRCGHRMACPNCAAWLVEHRAKPGLLCHHCGYHSALPTSCPSCHEKDSFVPIGPGVERIVEQVREDFPQVRLLVMSSDTLTSSQCMQDAVEKISAREVDLIIGTQSVAKGWHFPWLTLVGIVDADLGLGGGDLRAAERTVQLLHQVAGRAGRAHVPGRVYLQTYLPEHPAMQAIVSHDYHAFMREEAAQRRPRFWPPFGRLAALIISAFDSKAAEELARKMAISAPQGDGIEVLGPAPAPLAILRGRHRYRFLLRTRRDIALQPLIREWLKTVRIPRHCRVDVDIDPLSFF